MGFFHHNQLNINNQRPVGLMVPYNTNIIDVSLKFNSRDVSLKFNSRNIENDIKLIKDVVVDRFLCSLINNCKFVLCTGKGIKKIDDVREKIECILSRTELSLKHVLKMLKSIKENPIHYFSDLNNFRYYLKVRHYARMTSTVIDSKCFINGKSVTNLGYDTDNFKVLDDERLELFLNIFDRYRYNNMLGEIDHFCNNDWK